MKFKLLALAAAFAAGSVSAAVTYDENGVGFVGKGDIQAIYDWNNASLQEKHTSLKFRFSSGSQQASWKCSGVNRGGNLVTEQKNQFYQGASANVTYHARQRNQVTGFILEGADFTADTSELAVGECKKPNANWQSYYFVEGSLVFENADPILEVSTDGEDWYPLPVTD